MRTSHFNFNLFIHENPYFLAVFFGVLGAAVNLFPVELAFNISLVFGNTAYVLAASLLRPHLTFVCAIITAIPLYYHWSHPFGFFLFGTEALFISMLRARGWYVLTADLLYWLLVGMPLAALLVWENTEPNQSIHLFTILKQPINAMFYTSLACILLFTFHDYLQSFKSYQPPLLKSLPKWLLYSFWSISAFFVMSVALILSTSFSQFQQAQFDEELKVNNNYIAYISNQYLAEHKAAINNLAYHISEESDAFKQQEILNHFHQLYPGFLTMLITSEQGKVEVSSPISMINKLNGDYVYVKDRPYFAEAIKQEVLFVSEVFVGRGFGADPIVAISAPIYDKSFSDNPSGIVEGSLNLRDLIFFEQLGHDSNHMKTVVTDNENRIIYASDSLGLNTLSNFELSRYTDLNTANLIKLTNEVGDVVLFVHQEAKLDNSWKIHSLIAHDATLKIVEDMYLVMFLTLFLILLCATFFAKKSAIHFSRSLSFVMEQLSKATKADDLKEIPYETPTEIDELYHELKVNRQVLLNNQVALQQEVSNRTKELELANRKLTEQANTDALTGLHNRRYFEKNFALMQSILSHNNSSMMYAIVDIDWFKKINDTYGHLFGDFCLMQIADMLKAFFNRDADIVARFGGEEFTVVSQCQDIEMLKDRMEQFVHKIAIHQFKQMPIGPVHLTISIGVMVSEANFSHNQDAWFSLADSCLYEAKNKGRNQTIIKRITAS
jgi:diguanylate cyclase (GGDEF)-like protein